jgi:two-component system cell cycle sensor histidine kinase/response regulator CckA
MILVVDDERQIRSLVKSVLTRDGHRIIEASSGVEALAAWERSGGKIDLLLTDIVMPGMDGIELARQLSARASRLRVLYVSGKCEIDVLQEQVRKRGFGFLRKPFDIQGLRHAVLRMLDRPAKKEAMSEGGRKAKAVSGRR